MLISRGNTFVKVLKLTKAVQNVRNMSGHAFVYRVAAPPPSKATLYTSKIVGATMWWWILWHLWTEPDHITGEFEYPDPSKWSNAELGIPEE